MSAEQQFDNAAITYEYTRARAIEDGILVDVTKTASEAGFSVPVAITRAVNEQCVKWTKKDARRKPRFLQDEDGRLWDVVWMAACKARETGNAGATIATSLFQVYVVPRPGHGRRRAHTLKLVIGPGDTGEAVATIMLPDES